MSFYLSFLPLVIDLVKNQNKTKNSFQFLSVFMDLIKAKEKSISMYSFLLVFGVKIEIILIFV